MHTIRRTRDRQIPLLLRAEHEDRGPYFLVDRAGFGVSWRKPASERVPTGERSRSLHRGEPYTRKVTWIPIFDRARLAFTLVDEDEDVDAKLAKKIADQTYERLGPNARPEDAERYAFHLLKKGSASRDLKGDRARDPW